MKTNSEVTGGNSDSPLKLVALMVVGVSCFLQWISPSRLSGDSAFYTLPAVTGADLVHPHHLIYAVYLRGCYLVGSWMGLGAVPYLPMRAGMLVFASVGLVACYGFLRRLRCRPSIAAVGTLLISVSGLFWQFSTQTEAYIPTFSVLALAAWLTLVATQKVGRGRWITLVFAALLLAAATTFHQAAALAAPGLGLMAYIDAAWTDSRLTAQPARRRAVLAAVFLPVMAGAFSLLAYIMGWLVVKPGVSFYFWMTKYAHWEGMPWGVPENLTLAGAKMLFRSWGASWLNFSPGRFYDGVPKMYTGAITIVALVMSVAAGYLIYKTWRARNRPEAPAHITWILVWIAMAELFIWWWTPFLKNFQAIALLPQVALLAVAAEGLAQTRLKMLAPVALVFAALAVGVTNFSYMIIPGLTDRLAPEGDLLLVRPHLKEGDLFIAEFPDDLNMKALMDFQNASSIAASPTLAAIPNWQAETGKNKVVAVYKTSIGYSQVALDRSKTTIDQRWGPVFDKMEASAGGLKNLRSTTISTKDKLIAVVFGVSPDLPMSGAQGYVKMAEAASDNEEYALSAPQYYLNRVPREFRSPELSRRRQAAIQAGTLQPVWSLPFVTDDGQALWHGGIHAVDVSVTSDTISGKAEGPDPIVWTAFPRPQDVSMYTSMEIEAEVTPSSPATAPTTIQIFFQLADVSGVVEKNSVITGLPADGQRHTLRIDLTEYPFIPSAEKVVGLRLDPGDMPGSQFKIHRLVFRADMP